MRSESIIQIERIELIDALLIRCSYRHPVDNSLPKGYTPPTLAISNLYWKSWVILLVLSAFNTRTFGHTSWENYPTLKCMMEMVMTRNYVFPPPTSVVEDKTVNDFIDKERQIGEQEKQEILEFETHLAAATSKVTITEANSLLIAQLTTMDPNGPARKPPAAVLEQIKSLNDSLQIGQRLCRSLQPDFLLDIIQRQGTSKTMPWLAELVDGNEGSLQVLPVQCLCEFLLQDSDSSLFDGDDESTHAEKHKRRQKMKKKEQLLKHLQSLVHDESTQEEPASQVLDYFLKRLSSQQPSNRLLAIKGLWMVLSEKPMEEMIELDYLHQSKHSWLLTDLPRIPIFSKVKDQICTAIRQACQIETDPSVISSYIMFLSTQSHDLTIQQLDEVVLDMAQLIVERNTIVSHILPEEGRENSTEMHETLKSLIMLYNTYLKKAKEPQKEGYSWSNTQDQILLQWNGGDSATMHILVVHAMIILLTYGPPKCESQYEELLETWFPVDGSTPSAFLLDTSEEALLLPDWLKLRMIRSHVEQLVDVALQDIEPGQLLLFIPTFGIPVRSMTSLLTSLDKSVVLDRALVEQSVEDKQYMAQLIEIQHMRGAKGGELFYNLLKQGDLADKLAFKDVEMKDKTVRTSGWWQKSHLHKTTAAWDKEQIQTLLVKVYCGKPSSDDHRNYQTLLTTISRPSNLPIVQNIVSGIMELMVGPERAKFIKGILTNPKSCPLFKILVSHREGLGNHLEILMQNLSNVSQKSVLATIISKYHVEKGTEKSDQTKQQILTGQPEEIIKEIQLKADEGEHTVESLMKNCMKSLIKSDDVPKATELACTVILNSDNTPITQGMSTLLVDWLELLDPEVVKVVPELEQYLLFGKQQTPSGVMSPSGVNSPNCRAYLLAMLTHQTSWSSLHQCIYTVLKSDGLNSYNPSTVLDFLWACLQIPKIWKGREQKIPKNHKQEDISALTPQQVISVVEFIVQEVAMVTDILDIEDRIRLRCCLLMSCIRENEMSMKCAIKHITTTINDNRNKNVYEQLLMELYCQCPKVLYMMPESDLNMTDISTSQTFITKVDLVSHRLLTGLGQTGHGKRSEDRMSDATMACKKLAAQHPVLLLRQLPLIAALLKGKTEFKFGEMRHKNYVLMFTHIQGLLENLQPHVFYKDLTSLEDIIGSYFSLLQNHGNEKVLVPVIAKFIKFLNKFVNCQPQKSVVMLQKYIKLLSNVSNLYPEMAGLKSLLAGLSLPTQNKDRNSPVTESSLPALPPRPSSPYTLSQLAPFVKKFKGSSQDVLEVLRELDEFSKRKVDILENFMVHLKEKLSDCNDQIRNISFNLVMRHIRQNPGTAIQFAALYIQCLDDINPDVMTSALKVLPEFSVLCQACTKYCLWRMYNSIVTKTTGFQKMIEGQKVLQMERIELIDAFLNLCSYRHPVDISLPKGYTPPTLAISNLYWKSWVILLVLSAFNTRTFGHTSWENYPTLKCMMEMVMTRNYVFPPPTSVVEDKTVNDFLDKERQIGEQEKQEILEFETHLAAATSKVTITEANSLLIAQLTTMDPNGPARKPPAAVLEQIKSLNDSLQIGQRLCRSRQPDFLLDIIQRQGTSKTMPWLAELVDGNEGSLQVLPVQCLCEFLLQDSDSSLFDGDDESTHAEKHKRRQKMKKKEQLLKHLQSLVHDESTQEEPASQVLDYFLLKRLSSQQPSNRLLAIKACQIETDPSVISSYIMFLSTQSHDLTLQKLDEVVLDMAQLIVERNTIVSHILPEEGRENSTEMHETLKSLIMLYNTYLKKAKEPQKEGYSWSNTQDQILLQWNGGDSATMHILVVHAMIILLTYGPPKCESQYEELLETWFPVDGSTPSAFLLDTSEEALLLPDWLKLRMIRSHVEQLVDVALQDIEPGQLLLFIPTFGIPVRSMTSLLTSLDKSVVVDRVLVEQSVEDKQYMAQLIEIQHMRGAKGGELFYNLLKQGDLADKLASKDVEMKDKSVRTSGWWQKSHLHKTTAAWDKEQIQTLLVKVYCGKPSSDDHRNYQTLLTTISRPSNLPIVQNIVSGIMELMVGPERAKFIKGILTNPKSCPLFKILVSHSEGLGNHLEILMQNLSNVSQKSVLATIISKYHVEKGTEKSDPTKHQILTGQPKEIIKEIQLKADEGEQTVESLMKNCMKSLIKSDDVPKATELACTVILNSDNTPITQGMSTLLVDWLELLDPEVVKVVPELEQYLLFGKQQMPSGVMSPSGVNSPNCRAYLLAMLTHQTSWSSLHQCIYTVLKSDGLNSYNPSTVLDFLWACLQIPKIWKGREQKIPKNHKQEDILALTPQQVISVVEFIVQEVAMVTDILDIEDRIRLRCCLLMACIRENEMSMKCAIKHITTAINDNRNKNVYEQLLMELYCQCPKVLYMMPESDVNMTDISTSQTFITKVDLVSHRLLTGLGQTGHGKRSEDRMSDATMACKKLAAQHPVLLLRQLPLIAALLKGKTEFKFGEMRHKNYVLMFTHIQGLLENLQPHVFYKDLTSLEDIIGSYFSLLQNHGNEKVLVPVIAKFIKFLNKFVNCQPQKSVVMLQKYIKLLSNVSSHYPEMAGLKSLLAGLSLPTQNKDGNSPVTESSLPAIPPRPSSPYTLSQLAPFVKKFKGSSQDVLEVLRELDEFSKRKVDILENFMVHLKEKLNDCNDQIRNISFNLVMRHIRQNPGTAIQFAALYIQCLDDINPDVVTSALKVLPEFSVLCQDQANLILQKAFIIGTSTSIDTAPYITETLQLLNLDNMNN